MTNVIFMIVDVCSPQHWSETKTCCLEKQNHSSDKSSLCIWETLSAHIFKFVMDFHRFCSRSDIVSLYTCFLFDCISRNHCTHSTVKLYKLKLLGKLPRCTGYISNSLLPLICLHQSVIISYLYVVFSLSYSVVVVVSVPSAVGVRATCSSSVVIRPSSWQRRSVFISSC